MSSLDRARADRAMPSPFVFLVGCPRSGTTLLQRMLDAHPELTVANDTHFIPRAVIKVARGSVRRASAPAMKRALVEWTREYHRFPRLGLDRDAVDRADRASGTFPQFVGELYRELAECRGKALGGEKTPDYIRHLDLLHAMFPRSRFVHIVRDGRDVALSLLDWAHRRKGPGRLDLWRREPVATCALWWRWQVAGQRRGRELPDGRFTEVRYERLVADPERTLRQLSHRLGLRFSSRMLRFNAGRERREAGLSAKKAWLAPTTGLRDWRSQLDRRSVELFEALAGDVLEENGYRLSVASISRPVRAVADECRSWWEASMGASRPSSPARRGVGVG